MRFPTAKIHSDTRSNFLAIDQSSLLECVPTYGMNSTEYAQHASTCLGGWDIRSKFVSDFRADVGSDNVLLIDAGDMLSGTTRIYRSRCDHAEPKKKKRPQSFWPLWLQTTGALKASPTHIRFLMLFRVVLHTTRHMHCALRYGC